jgi:diadenosine tetraphosphate (Ap4A) HIT family hydrolase
MLCSKSKQMDFQIGNYHGFEMAHCLNCAVPGYLVVSPRVRTLSLSDLPLTEQQELGPALTAATSLIEEAVAPIKIYCAQFAEATPNLHFHEFPRTHALTSEFLRSFPEQGELIHGPILLDWARDRYAASEVEVWGAVSSTVSYLRKAFSRITSRYIL